MFSAMSRMSSRALFSGSASAPSKSRLKTTTMRGFARAFTLTSFYRAPLANCNVHYGRLARRAEIEGEGASKGESGVVRQLRERRGPAAQAGDGGDAGVPQPAGDDGAEGVQRGADVEREAVGRHPLADVHTEGTDLLAADPDARAIAPPLGADVQPVEHLHDRGGHPLDVSDEAAAQAEDGVADQLSWTVVGHVSAARHPPDGDLTASELA